MAEQETEVFVAPTSFAQAQLWLISELAASYNVPLGIRLRGRLETPVFERALAELVGRHETLRTCFAFEDGEPVQLIAARLVPRLPTIDLSALPAARAEAEAGRQSAQDARRPFDLARAPLFRAFLFRLAAAEHVFFLNLHHIVTDAWSLDVLLGELFTVYQARVSGSGAPLAPLPLQYADYATWQREWLRGDELVRRLEPWRRRLAGAPVETALPSDWPRGRLGRAPRGAIVSFELPGGLPEALARLSRGARTTSFMTLLASDFALLARLTGQDDLLIGAPVANRTRPETEAMIGLFSNLLPLRLELGGDPTVATLLQRTREVCLEAFANQEMPFEKLVQELRPERRANQNPLCTATFSLDRVNPAPAASAGAAGLSSEVFGVHSGTAKFEIQLSVLDSGSKLEGFWEYRSDLFERATIERWTRHWFTLLGNLVEHPERRLSELALLGEADLHQITREWNDGATAFPRHATLPELFAAQVARTPGAPALAWEGGSLSYAELARRAGRLANRILQEGRVRPAAAAGTGAGSAGLAGGDRLVGLCLERSPEMVVAMLAALLAGRAYLPLDPGHPAERLAYMLDDAGAEVVVTRGRLRERLAAAGPRLLDLDELDLLAPLDPLDPAADGGEPTFAGADAARLDPRSLAYVIYTSGSTGMPKGVAVPQCAVARLVLDTDYVRLGPGDRIAQVSNASFDAATFEIWGALLTGGCLVMIEREVSLSPERLAAALRGGPGERITTLFITTALFNRMVAADPACFSSLDTLLFGGEAVDPTRVAEALAAGPPGRLLHVYGPTEGTTFSTWYTIAAVPEGAVTVPIGRPLANTRLLLLDRDFAPVPIGVAGELYLGGDGLARGYLNRPDLTAERFVPWGGKGEPGARPFDSGGEPGARLYRTGDLARFRGDGAVEFLGRIDGQVKIRGFRIEPAEIEAALAAHPQIAACTVMARRNAAGELALAAWFVPRQEEGPPPRTRELREFLAGKLPDYMVPAAWVPLDELPRNPNGKIDRKALPEPDFAGVAADGFTLPRTPVEEVLAGIWATVLRRDRVGVEDNFFELGGHSLTATVVASQARAAFGVEVPTRAMFEAQTLGELAARIEELLQVKAGLELPPITPVERHAADSAEPFEAPLSFAQQRLWFLDKLAGGKTPHYNIGAAIALKGNLVLEAMAGAFAALVGRHEVLRTIFRSSGQGRAVQRILPPSSWPAEPLAVADLSSLPEAAKQAEAKRLGWTDNMRPFSLIRGPVLRASLLRMGPQRHVLLLNMHHIISDGWSLDVFLRELGKLYVAYVLGLPAGLPRLPVQYGDFATWQRQWLTGPVLEAQLAYWKGQLAGAPLVLELPLDRPRPATKLHLGGKVMVVLSLDLTRRLQALTRANRVTLYMTLFGAYATLLQRYTGQDDLLIGSPVAGRGRTEIQGLIGFFVNMLVMRADLRGAPSFTDLLARVRETALGAYAHQDVPFERLVEELHPKRDLSRNPLFQAMLSVLNMPWDQTDPVGLHLDFLEIEGAVELFDISLQVEESEDKGLEMGLGWDKALLETATMKRLAGHLEALITGLVAAPQRPACQVPILSAAEIHQLAVEWNDRRTDWPRAATLAGLFAEQVARDPAATALSWPDGSITYAQLARAARRIAGRLGGLGARPDLPIGICLERSPELVASILGVIESGAAYLPLDPAHPPERMAYMLGHAGARLVVTRAGLAGRFAHPELAVGVLNLDEIDFDEAERAAEAAGEPEAAGGAAGNGQKPGRAAEAGDAAGPDHLAYVIYTSGSTGRPKGVAVEQQAVVRLVRETDYIRLGPHDRIAQVASASFDVFTFEIWGALLNGGCLVLLHPEVYLSTERFGATVRDERITAMSLTPTVFNRMIATDPASFETVDTVLVTGEALDPGAIGAALASRPPRRLLNAYGPTESTTWSTWHEIRQLPEGATNVPIGRPLANSSQLVLDRWLQPVPPGVRGELYLGGDGLARGYQGSPDLTAERFLPWPAFAPAGGQGAPGGPGRGGQPGARMYRTGDLVRQRPDGVVEFLGRIDDQVKIRGVRIELGEIEAALASHPQVALCSVVVRRNAAGEQALAAYVVLRQQGAVRPRELRDFVAARLPDSMVPAAWVELTDLPLNSSGKVDRDALPEPSAEGLLADTFVAPRTVVEDVLAIIWSEILQVERIGVHDNFFDLGGHSLTATVAASQARSTFGVEVETRTLFEAPTLGELAGRIQKLQLLQDGLELPPVAAMPAELRAGGELPLSFAQQRLWFLDELAGRRTPEYNIAAALSLDGRLEVAALAAALVEIVRRHEVLRTTFGTDAAGQPVQRPMPAGGFQLPLVDLQELPSAAREAEVLRLAGDEVRRPFSLARDAPFRACLVRRRRHGHVLLATMHHIVSDGWSLGVFVREMGTLYTAALERRGSPLRELRVQYSDFAWWQRNWLEGAALDVELAYWKRQLEGAPQVLELPLDHPRPATQRLAGAAVPLHFLPEAGERLRTLARERRGTLFMALLASFTALLYRMTGQEDLLVGAPVANRNQVETEELIGFFVNMLVLRADLSAAPTFNELLDRVREAALGAYSHQDLPFERLVEELKVTRDLGRTPLFQVSFSLANTPREESRLPELTIGALAGEHSVELFDLSLETGESEEGVQGYLSYSTSLFEATTAARLARRLEALVAAWAEDPGLRVPDLPLLSDEERHELLAEWGRGAGYGTSWGSWRSLAGELPPAEPAGDGAMETGQPPSLAALVEAWARRGPAAPALAWQDGELTYDELNRRANRLAWRLHRLGAGPETVVGIALPGAAARVTALLAVLKAGAAFLPLDPRVPAERRAFMLADSGATLLLAQQAGEGLERAGAADVADQANPANIGAPERDTRMARVTPVWLDSAAEQAAVAAESGENPGLPVLPEALAYVIYTSGSTGQPKGVMVSHRELARHCPEMASLQALAPGDRVLQMAAFGFDLSVEEVLKTLVAGATFRLWSPAVFGASELARELRLGGVTHVGFTATLFHQVLREWRERGERVPEGLRSVLAGAEALAPEAVRLWRELGGAEVPLCNQYGPTEVTITATFRVTSAADAASAAGAAPPPLHATAAPSVPIGRPLPGRTTYVTGPQGDLVPPGVGGELWLGGAGLARGYLGRPEATAAAFVPDPWSGLAGARLYRSGDLARFGRGGELEFLGRRDRQLKLRGFRVEPGEIEAALSAHPQIEAAAVILETPEAPAPPPWQAAGAAELMADGPEKHDRAFLAETAMDRRAGGEPELSRLVAYYLAREGAEPEPAQLRAFLGARLPASMIPAAFFRLQEFPRNANGKLDHAALRRLRPGSLEPAATLAARRDGLEQLVAGTWRELLAATGEAPEVGLDDSFFDLGGHSLLLTRLRKRLEDALGLEIPVVELFSTPTVRAMAEMLRHRLAAAAPAGLPAAATGPAPPTLQSSPQPPEAAAAVEPEAPTLPQAAAPPAPPATSSTAPDRDLAAQAAASPGAGDIAVIGMALRLPGASTVEEYWQNLRQGVESITFDTAEGAAWQPPAGASVYEVPARGVIAGADLWDAAFFGAGGREAELTDPQQRLILECAWEALEHAGYAPGNLPELAGAFCGIAKSDYRDHLLRTGAIADAETLQTAELGNSTDFLASRLAYKLGLQGPAVSIQTACSTSLVAVHMACRSLLAGDCSLALAGGAAVGLPYSGYVYTEGGPSSRDGHTRSFDASASGTVDSDGVGIVVLKRLDDALADRDTIHAVIKASGIANDGSAKLGFSAHSREGQARLVARTLARAGIAADSIGYVEAHGSAGPLTEPLEIGALTLAFGESTDRRGFCALGSVKSNIGHTGAASGVAGLIKAVLSVEQGEIPPNLHFQSPNPALELAASPFFVNTWLRPWASDNGPRRAAVTSLGLGGTNAHVVVEEPPAAALRREPEAAGGWRLLTLSARSEAALDAAAARLADHLERHPRLALGDVAYTLAVGRRPLAHRRIAIARETGEAAALLTTADPSRVASGQVRQGALAAPELAFIFSGTPRGLEAAADLYRAEPLFRREVDRCSDLLRGLPALAGSDLRDRLFGSGEAASAEPHPLDLLALFTLEYALAATWMSWGAKPQALSGEGVGEVVAACLAGTLSLAEALQLIAGQVPGRGPGQVAGHAGPGDAQASDLASRLGQASSRPPAIPILPRGDLAAWAAEPSRLLLEVGPAATLSPSSAMSSGVSGVSGASGASDTGPREAQGAGAGQLLLTLGRLWLAGVAVDWPAFYRAEAAARRRVPLPTYPFERRRYWVDPPEAQAAPPPSPEPVAAAQARGEPGAGPLTAAAGADGEETLPATRNPGHVVHAVLRERKGQAQAVAVVAPAGGSSGAGEAANRPLAGLAQGAAPATGEALGAEEAVVAGRERR